MDTSQVLDLFAVQGKKERKVTSEQSTSNKTSMAQNMGDLWDEKQYESEYDLDSFMNSLKS